MRGACERRRDDGRATDAARLLFCFSKQEGVASFLRSRRRRNGQLVEQPELIAATQHFSPFDSLETEKLRRLELSPLGPSGRDLSSARRPPLRLVDFARGKNYSSASRAVLLPSFSREESVFFSRGVH